MCSTKWVLSLRLMIEELDSAQDGDKTGKVGEVNNERMKHDAECSSNKEGFGG